MTAEPVLYQTEHAVAAITLNRPDVLNALDDALVRALREAVERAAADEAVRAVLLTGAGRGFSAGADLASIPPGRVDLGQVLRERYHPLILALRRMPKPVVCAVNGAAAGAGMSIALAADIVLAARSAYFVQSFAKIGLIPDAGSTWLLPRLAGASRARAMALLAERIDAEQACRFGLVWEVLDDEALLPHARRLAAHLATQPTRACALIKQAFEASDGHDLAQQLELEATLQAQAGDSDDFREGVAAFLQRRPPVFRGR
ncbi:MAG: enoyl-CoA hydratase/isomerase family protein [Burkholderiales bacterium]|nr:enoyl-CoA hydratase/isomerase family protein [Burkholderiales bacterium]OJX09312.1 MAG: 2-(1,2-epoxy-1,2-dihydrophenyl)acetyl-CoA isomerase [Burkholderiales bacterium 70-64]